MLKEVLIQLRDGKQVSILEDHREEYLRFENGQWLFRYRNCWSDTCNCVSHDTYYEDSIGRKEALSFIREYISSIEKDHKERAIEILWLDERIRELISTV